MKHLVFLLLVLTLSIGCAQRQVTLPEESAGQSTGAEGNVGERGEKVEEGIGSYGAEKVKGEEITGDNTGTPDSTGEGVFPDIYFDYDSYEIMEDFKPVLRKIADWSLTNGNSRILVEGHCDDRGTNEYNLALGDQRAQAVRDYLLSLGLDYNKIEIISYGEERPQCFELSESCRAKNRRAHFIEYKEGGQ